MAVLTLSKESHKDPSKFRIQYETADTILGNNFGTQVDNKLPVIETESKVAVIGGGFGGLGIALSILKKLKTDDFVIFEKHDDFGGTWYANTYPGCASDIPAILYLFSDELVNNWSDIRPPQFEMEEYIQRLVVKYGLRERCNLSTQIFETKWIEKIAKWEITGLNLKTGQRIKHTAKIIANSTGSLVVPNKFNPLGLENFKGDVMHSAIWNHNVSFKGKKVVVVGNGCSAAQVIPALLDDYEPESIVQLVRTPHWIFPPHPRFLAILYWLLGWSTIGLLAVRYLVLFGSEIRYPMYSGNGRLSRFVRWLNTRVSRRYMKSKIPEKYHDILIPKYKIGCKRLIFDYHYAPSLQDERIDVKRDEIAQVKSHSVVLKSGEEIRADIIVTCVGYNVTKSYVPYTIIGKDGFVLNQEWLQNGIAAYETILPKNVPNFFFLAGPNSVTGHSSVILAIENGCEYFTTVSSKILDGTYDVISVKPEKYDEWHTTTQELLKRQIFGTSYGGCVAWYTNEKGNPASYPFSQIKYHHSMTHVKWEDLINYKV